MNRFFTKTFFRFFFSFLAIITVAFGVIVIASSLNVPAIDTVAFPR